MNYMVPDVHCPQKAIKLNHSLIDIFSLNIEPSSTMQYITKCENFKGWAHIRLKT